MTHVEPKHYRRGDWLTKVVLAVVVIAGISYAVKEPPVSRPDPERVYASQEDEFLNSPRRSEELARAQVKCMNAVKAMAKYNEPKFPWLAFSRAATGGQAGEIRLIDRDIQHQNGPRPGA